MKIRTIWSLAASTMMIVALTACSGNPVGDKDVVPKTTAAPTNKTVKKVTKVALKKTVVKKAVVEKVEAKKTSANKKTVVTRKALAKTARTVKKPLVIARAKPLSRAQSRAKKQSIAALGKSRQAQARLNYARAQARKKYIEKQELETRRAQNIRNIRIANYRDKVKLGLDRFTGSQADVPVVRRTAKPVRKPIVRRVATRAKPAPVRRVVVARAKQPLNTRSLQPIRTRAKQPVRSRAQQPVRSRARQVVRTRSQQQARTRARQPVRARSSQRPVRPRARQPVRARSQQPVRPRARQYAARSNHRKSNFRKVSVARRPAVNRARKNVRKAVYKKPAQRRVSRIDPNTSFGYALSNAAIERTKHRVRYDGKYVKIGYPWGDVPKSIGVCTDVVIRAYRRLGIDLQQEVHKDISQDFYAYPNLVKWGLKKPDPNIDHRRVYNLQAFFKRHKAELPRSRNPRHYKPGDLVTWMVGPNFPHIGVVVNKPSKADPNRLMIAHNVGYGPQIEDILFRYPMTGHYRYTPQNKKINPALLFAKTPPPASVLRRQQNNGMTYAEMLQANKILSGKVQARSLPSLNDLLVDNKKARSQGKIMLAHLDASIFNSAGVNQDALQALLK